MLSRGAQDSNSKCKDHLSRVNLMQFHILFLVYKYKFERGHGSEQEIAFPSLEIKIMLHVLLQSYRITFFPPIRCLYRLIYLVAS